MELLSNNGTISPNNGTSLNDVLRPKLLNIPLASCYLMNLDFSLSHIAHFDNNIVLPLLVSETLGFMFLYLLYTLNYKITLFYICLGL